MAKEKRTVLQPWKFVVNEEKKTVLYTVIAHGHKFVGKATCNDSDEFDVEKGKAIAQMRAVLAQRKFDLELTREFIVTVQGEMARASMFNQYGAVSPHYMRSIQTACEEEKAQLAHIRDLKNRLKELGCVA